MKYAKRICSAAIVISILCSIACIQANAYNEPLFEKTLQIAETFVADNICTYGMDSGKTISRSIPLYNLNNELEAYCHIFEPAGYAIVNINSGIVSEYSETEQCLIPDTAKQIFYNGPLRYYFKEGSSFVHVITGERSDNLKQSYGHLPVAYTTSIEPRVVTIKSLKHPLETLRGGVVGACPITGISIMFSYYANYLGATFPGGIKSSVDIGNYMKNNGYLSPDPIWFTDALWAHKDNSGNNYVGLWNFVTSKSNFEVYANTMHWGGICGQIDSDHPIAMEIRTEAISSNPNHVGTHHIVVVHGYCDRGTGSTALNYLNVNNGWGQNNISLYWKDVDEDFHYLVGVPQS